MNKTILFVAALIIVIIAGIFLIKNTETAKNLPPPANLYKNQPKTVQIIYGVNGYIPSQAFINSGDTVQFKNLGKSDMWPALDNNPDHEIYPEFDAKQAIKSGEIFSFTFNKTGIWNYYDHLTPSHKATITVK